MEKEIKKRCLPSIATHCSHLVRRPKFSLVNEKNISWWDNQIKKEIDSIIMKDLSYKDLVTKRRMQRRSYFHSMSSLACTSKSIHRIPYGSRFYEDDLVSALKKFFELPKQNARIWQKKSKIYKPNPMDSYQLIEDEMKGTFVNFCNEKIEKDNKNIKEVLNNLFSTEDDPLSLSSVVKISPKLHKVLPDITIKNVGKPKMLKNEMISRMIHRDLKTLKRKKSTQAFGSALRKPIYKVDKYDFKTKYVNIGPFHEELETFKSVWEDILELETTRKFCTWLKEHENIHPPRYLVQKGALKRRFKSIDKSQELLLANLEGYNTDIKNSDEFFDIVSKYRSSINENSSYSSSSRSSSALLSLDISDINIII